MKTDAALQHKANKLFDNRVMERLSRTPIQLPISIFLVYGMLLLAASISYTSLNLELTVMMFVLGLLSFSWVEYMVHRHIFHMATDTSLKKRLQFVFHGIHHAHPKDKDRLAMPPLLSVGISTSLLFLLRSFMGDWSFSFMAGFSVGYAFYLFIHYLVHAYPPPKNKLRAIWTNHSIHHYKNTNAAFGVTSPMWDFIYGTRHQRNNL
jgi:sterol desaturase/sphingolipid hydroxylase (fatty acid hydroxylase superfamily)